MDQDSSPTDLLHRYRQGDPDAARALFDRYAQRLCQLAERHLSRKLAGRTDGEDVVQSAFRTFFLRVTAVIALVQEPDFLRGVRSLQFRR